MADNTRIRLRFEKAQIEETEPDRRLARKRAAAVRKKEKKPPEMKQTEPAEGFGSEMSPDFVETLGEDTGKIFQHSQGPIEDNRRRGPCERQRKDRDAEQITKTRRQENQKGKVGKNYRQLHDQPKRHRLCFSEKDTGFAASKDISDRPQIEMVRVWDTPTAQRQQEQTNTSAEVETPAARPFRMPNKFSSKGKKGYGRKISWGASETKTEKTAASSLSRWYQRSRMKQGYLARRFALPSSITRFIPGVFKQRANGGNIRTIVVSLIAKGQMGLIFILPILLFVMLVTGAISSCSVVSQSGSNVILGTSYTADDEDILGAEADYLKLEEELQNKLHKIEETSPGYDEYRYYLDEIEHNPYELASYLTVMYEDYTRAEIQDALQQIFDEQYVLTLEEITETRTRTETVTDPETGLEKEIEVEYEYYILCITLQNKGLEKVIEDAVLTDDQRERYEILMETLGNKSYLFGGEIYLASEDYLDYQIPGEALTDTDFAAMVQEAEKYLGYTYEWGGSTPETGFDCSGFVSWVINHSGWDAGRRTANGLKNYCTQVEPGQAKPGDLIFFQGTYQTSGASHVGIYVGNGMMIHCGNPISYASVNTRYWQEHFLCFGRLP